MGITQRKLASGYALHRTLIAVITTLGAGAPAYAVEIPAGDWKFTAKGNVNAYYINSQCEPSTAPIITGGLACRGVDTTRRSSAVSNGLLPAALVISAGTTQRGIDIAATFGFYPGITTNDGGSPNLQQTVPDPNTALGTTAIDMRQVFMTIGSPLWGEFMLGRNIGLFQGDAILNDMTLPGVGGGNGNYASPPNTALGSIGLGYIYADWYAQMNYTTPDIFGLKLTVGIFSPLQPLQNNVPAVPQPQPGLHGKLAWKWGPIYISGTYINQRHNASPERKRFNSNGYDVGGKFSLFGIEAAGWYYNGKGLGTTALFNFSDDFRGHRRDSHGYLVQLTYKLVPLNLEAIKIGAQYGSSSLRRAPQEPISALVTKNWKYTAGIYYSLTENLTLIGEFTQITSESQRNRSLRSKNFNVGAYLAF
jgi:predicted porin